MLLSGRTRRLQARRTETETHQLTKKDGSPRAKPGPKPKEKPPARRHAWECEPSLEHVPDEIAQALAICREAYSSMTAELLQSLHLAPGQLPTKQQAEMLRTMASTAYRMAMPVLVPGPQLQAFIACTALGVSLGVFTGRTGSQLLYAAQVTAGSATKAAAASKK